ncbi:SDR family oxidoreductase [Phaeobacter sp. CNT1-3]|nr:SDR family oxidoreductase [Phaeobacter sp. CNT1-3]
MTLNETYRTDAPKTVLIAGGCGFLGSWLCERHLALGDRVICVDNLLTGRLSNVAGLLRHPNFTYLNHDIVHPLPVRDALAGPIDQIFNMACAASPPKYQLDPIHTFQTNIWGVQNLLELARLKGARFLQSSTSEVYGDPLQSPQVEDYKGNVNTYGPRACYDEGKRAAETLILEYRRAYGVETRIARIFNTYGPRMRPDDGRVISNFVVEALLGDPITIYGDGSQTRSFCYVEDQIDGLMALMASPDWHQPVNIGNPDEHSVLEMAEIVLAKTGSGSKLVFCDLPQDDPMIRRPCIARAKEVLGWAPRVGLDEGLEQTIAAFLKELDNGQLHHVAAQ